MKAKGIPGLIMAAIIIGSIVIIGKISAGIEGIFLVQMISLIISSGFLYIFIGRRSLDKELKKLARQDYMLIGLQAFFGIAMYRVLIIYGSKFITAIEAGMILSLLPVITVVMAVLFLKEKLDTRDKLAMLLAFGGMYLINLKGYRSNGILEYKKIIGVILVFLAACGEGGFVILSKKMSTDVKPIVKSFLLSLFAFILFVPMGIYELFQNPNVIIEGEFWMVSVYTGVVLSAAAYILWFSNIKHVSGTFAGIINCLIPVSSIILSFIIFRDSISRNEVMGVILIIVGALGMVFKKNEGERVQRFEYPWKMRVIAMVIYCMIAYMGYVNLNDIDNWRVIALSVYGIITVLLLIFYIAVIVHDKRRYVEIDDDGIKIRDNIENRIAYGEIAEIVESHEIQNLKCHNVIRIYTFKGEGYIITQEIGRFKKLKNLMKEKYGDKYNHIDRIIKGNEILENHRKY